MGRGLHFGDVAVPRRLPGSTRAGSCGGRRTPRRPREDGGGAGHSVAGRPEWLLSADRSRRLSRAGTAAGTSPTHQPSPADDGGADRLAALGSPRIIRRHVEKRLVAALGLSDRGGGCRPRCIRLPEVAWRESCGVPRQPYGNRAECLPTGEVGQRTVLSHGD